VFVKAAVISVTILFHLRHCETFKPSRVDLKTGKSIKA